MAVICGAPMASHAAIPYRVQQTKMPAAQTTNDRDSGDGRVQNIYVGGWYNFSIWQNGADENVHVTGKTTSSFDAVVGLRVYDTFRIEANYIRTRAKWDAFSLNGHAGFINAIMDARIDNMYRLFYKQSLVPYVGIGAGASWNKARSVEIDNKVSPAFAAMAGLGIEMGDYFTLDLGYRYLYMFSPKFDAVSDLAPAAHQFRVGARINF